MIGAKQNQILRMEGRQGGKTDEVGDFVGEYVCAINYIYYAQ